MRCPVCNAEDLHLLAHDRHRSENNYMTCNSCTHNFCSLATNSAQLEEVNKRVYSDIPKHDENQAGSADKVIANNTYPHWLINKATTYITQKSEIKFLEVGCNTGRILKVFSQDPRFLCFGNDIVPQTCQYVSRSLGITVFEGAFNAKLVHPEKFDVILLSHVMEHLSDLHTFLHELSLVSKPESLIMVVVPHDASLMASFKRTFLYPSGVIGEYGYLHYPLHLQGYSKKSLVYLFESHGFLTLECSTLTKCQREYDAFFRHKWDWAFMLLYLLEHITKQGNLLYGFFQKNNEEQNCETCKFQ